MTVRLISAAVAIIIGVSVIFFLPVEVFYIAVSLLCAIAVYELLHAAGDRISPAVMVVSIVVGFAVPFCCLLSEPLYFIFVLLGYGLFLAIWLVTHHTVAIETVGYAFFVTCYATVSFLCLNWIRHGENGMFHMLLALFIPWICDGGAYFAGTFFGKHKMCPNISPKKTWEGFFGGLAVGMLMTMLFGWLFFWITSGKTEGFIFWQVAIVAPIVGLVSVVGDLFASVIKRQYGVKDFGKIMPGHGGVMDRFDSVCLSVPVLLALVQVFPMLG